ncbi:polysaccharide deacetylase family protein [bacterium]|nr:polysaccharide deacetylase family protein [bacterium]
MKCILSVDVEDWFHILEIPDAPNVDEWGTLHSRIEENFVKLLDIIDERNVKVTCFFLGWVAAKYPHLVREASQRGHEIASHGYYHELVYRMTAQEFLEDITKTKTLLEDISGKKVSGYRSAGFSTTESTPWFFEKLVQAGYEYDSSIFPAPRAHGGMKSNLYAPYAVNVGSSRIIEFPISVKNVLGFPICFFGGGYLRFFPYIISRRMAKKVLKDNRPVIFYIHPREIDPGQPRLKMNITRRFKSYFNLRSTRSKIVKIMDDFELTTFRSFINEYFNVEEVTNGEKRSS